LSKFLILDFSLKWYCATFELFSSGSFKVRVIGQGLQPEESAATPAMALRIFILLIIMMMVITVTANMMAMEEDGKGKGKGKVKEEDEEATMVKECGGIASEEECVAAAASAASSLSSSRRRRRRQSISSCEWCKSEHIDDACFSSSEAWKLPPQVFVCTKRSSSLLL
jgi:hypothetical protein